MSSVADFSFVLQCSRRNLLRSGKPPQVRYRPSRDCVSIAAHALCVLSLHGHFVKIKIRALDWLLAIAVVSACRLLFRTLRFRFIEGAPHTNPYDPACADGLIFCVWHDAIAYPMFSGRHLRTVALVSKNFD